MHDRLLNTASLAVVLLCVCGTSVVAAPPAARIPIPDGMMSADDADTLEHDLDAFFATSDAGKRKEIFDKQLVPHKVGLTLDELNAMDDGDSAAAKNRRDARAGGVSRFTAPGREDHPRGFFNIAVPSDYSPKKSWPLLVALHGRGGTADDLVDSYLPAMTNAGWIVLFPTTAELDHYWSTTSELANVYRLIEWTARRFRVDMRRIAVSGVSMGGMGTWSHLRSLPELWSAGAALIGNAGLIEGPSFDRLRGIPVYMLQGEKDTGTKVEDTRRMISELKSRRIEVVYVELPGVGHMVPSGEWPKVHAWLIAQQAKPWSPRPILLPTDGQRPLWQATEDPFGLSDANDPVVSLLRAGDIRGAQTELRKKLLRNNDVARLYVLRAIATVPALLEPTPERLDPATLVDGVNGWNAAGEDAALNSLRLAISSKGKGPAERRFDAEVNHLIARIWAKRFATSVAQGGNPMAIRYNNFARYAHMTQELQPGHLETNRLIGACNALVPKQ